MRTVLNRISIGVSLITVLTILNQCGSDSGESVSTTAPVVASPTTTPPPTTTTPAVGANVIVSDPLTDGTTLATNIEGGTFVTGQGWRVDSSSNSLRYVVPSISDGSVEWQNTGLTKTGATDDSHMLMGMFDPSAGIFRANAFRVNVQKLWSNPHNPPFVRLRFISQGRQQDAGMNFNDWDPGTVYTWRLEWGPGGGANTAKVFLDESEILQIRYNRAYTPNTHWIEFGPSSRNESVVDAIYSNIKITKNN